MPAEVKLPGEATTSIVSSHPSSVLSGENCHAPRKVAKAGPDTGWAWVIVAAAFFIYINTFGVNRSVGVFFVSIVQTFGVSRKQASWPFTICHVFICLTGPVAGVLNRYLSIRKLTLIGCGTCALGFILSFFADSVLTLSITLGAVHGIGLGINMVQNSVVLNHYFVRHRATASGLAFAGGNIGSFIYPPLMEYFIHEYGLKGAFLLVGGMMLNALVAASFYRTPLWLRTAKSRNAAKKLASVTNKNLASEIPLLKHQDNQSGLPNGHNESLPNNASKDERNGHADEATLPMISSHDPTDNKGQASVDAVSDLDINKRRPKSKSISIYRDDLAHIGKVLMHPMFVLVCLTQIIFFWIFLMYVMLIVDFARDRGVTPEDAVVLLSIFGISDIIGRLGSGWISDSRIISRKNVTFIGLFLMGLFLHLTPLVWDYYSLMAVCLLFGFASGCVIILINVLFAEYLGLDKLPVAVGCSSFLGGMVAFTRPSLIGYFRDTVGSYDGLFHLQGTVAFLGATGWLFEPLIQRKMKEKEARKMLRNNNNPSANDDIERC